MSKSFSVEDQLRHNRSVAQQSQSGNWDREKTPEPKDSATIMESLVGTSRPIPIEDATGRLDALAFQPIVRSVKSRDR
jgi:hypothetical protein